MYKATSSSGNFVLGQVSTKIQQRKFTRYQICRNQDDSGLPKMPSFPNLLGGKGKEEGKEGGGPFKNPFGDMGQLMDQIKSAQRVMQEKTKVVQKELAEARFSGYDGEEMVKATVSGQQEPRGIEITQAAYDLGPEQLEQKINEALQEAHVQSIAGASERMAQMAEEMGLPRELAEKLQSGQGL